MWSNISLGIVTPSLLWKNPFVHCKNALLSLLIKSWLAVTSQDFQTERMLGRRRAGSEGLEPDQKKQHGKFVDEVDVPWGST